nr:hypothetical protein [Tanacetum cinerariifolium]
MSSTAELPLLKSFHCCLTIRSIGSKMCSLCTKKNQLKLQYGNFKAEGSETLEQTFNRLEAIMSQLEFMDVEIKQDDLNQKFLTSLAPEWLMYIIVWRNIDDLDTMSLDDVYNHLKVYEPKVQKKPGSNTQNMAFISLSNTSSGKGEVPTASEESSHCQKKRDATAHKIALLLKSSSNEVPTTSEESSHCQKKRDATAHKIALLLKSSSNYQSMSYDSFANKYKTTQELWAAILKTFSGNEATKKTKKNLLKQQYGNFKAEGSETLDDLNKKFLTSLAPEWLMHTIVWRNRSDLDTMSLDDLYNHLKVYESEVQKKSVQNSHNMAFISSAKHSRGNEEVNTASVSTASTNVSTASANIRVASISQDTACAYITSQSSGSQIKFEDKNQIDEDDMEDMDIK